MACALISDTLKVYLKAGETRLSVLLGGQPENARPVSRSALQNPELSRYELDCLLRRGNTSTSRQGWASFFAGSAACANTNATGAEIS